jgi:assimilatory nitrate reductase catalytic subunit
MQELPAQAYGRLLLAPGAKAPVALQAKGVRVCTCFGVDANAIETHLANSSGTAHDRLASLQARLRCGTNCGSCIPELKRMVRSAMPGAEGA